MDDAEFPSLEKLIPFAGNALGEPVNRTLVAAFGWYFMWNLRCILVLLRMGKAHHSFAELKPARTA
jgi:hypothetical protein